MLLKGLIWLRVLVNTEWMFILYVNLGSLCTCWATSCFTRWQCCGLDNQGIILQFLAGRSILSSSKHTDSPHFYSVHTQDRAAGPGSKPLIYLCPVPGLRMCGAICAVHPHPSELHGAEWNMDTALPYIRVGKPFWGYMPKLSVNFKEIFSHALEIFKSKIRCWSVP